MARSREKDRRIGAVFSSVRECRMPKLVKRPSTGRFAEQLGGTTVRQPGEVAFVLLDPA